MDRWKSRGGKSQRREGTGREETRRDEKRRSEKRKSQKKEKVGGRKGRKVAKHCVFSNDLWLRRKKCITTTHLSYSVLSLKLPPPPCAVLLVYVRFAFTQGSCSSQIWLPWPVAKLWPTAGLHWYNWMIWVRIIPFVAPERWAQARWKTMGVWRWTKKLSNHPLLPVVHSRLFFLYIPNLGVREQ